MLPYLHWKICKGLQIKRGRELLLYAIQSLNIFVAVSFVTRLAESSLHRLAVFTISQPLVQGSSGYSKHTAPCNQPRSSNLLCSSSACQPHLSRRPTEQPQIAAFRDIRFTTGTELVLNFKLSRKVAH